jgi:hypothetical protein
MALSPYKTFIAGEILTAADLNASFSQITSNGLQLISPLTGTLDADGRTIIFDADADSNMAAGTDDILTLTLQSFAAFIWDGDVATPVNGITFRSAATTTNPAIVAHGTDTDIGLLLQGKGAGKVALGSVPLLFPNADGAADEYLKTDGAGNLAFAAIDVTFASGDRIAFQQTTPGGSFVKDVSITTNSAVRLTTGSIADDLTGSAFTTIFATGRATGNESVGHTHSVSVSGNATANNTWSQASGSDGANGRYWVQSATPTFAFAASVTSGGISVNHTHTTDMKVDYYDFTIGEAA